MTKTDADYEAEYEAQRVLNARDTESRIAANESLVQMRNDEVGRLRLATRTEIERQLMDCQAWIDGYEAQLPVVKDTQNMLANWGTMDPNAALKRVMALSQIKEWLAREGAHAEVYKKRIAVLLSRLETI